MHFSFLTLAALALAFAGAPLAQFVAAKRDKLRAETEHLKAQAEAIKNPVERNLATLGVRILPVALDAAASALQGSRDHVVAEVSKVNPDAGALVGTLIDTALTVPATPLAEGAGVPGPVLAPEAPAAPAPVVLIQ
jgi:hypothetical protein